MSLTLLFGMGLPWTTGMSFLTLLDSSKRSWGWRIGAGWLLGQVLLAATLYGQSALAGRIHVIGTIITLMVIGVAIEWMKAHRRRWAECDAITGHPARVSVPPVAKDEKRQEAPWSGGASAWFAVAFALMAVLTAARLAAFVGVAMDVPIRADDAYTIWLYKAKVIAGLGALPLDPAAPFYQAGSYTNYPPLVPLIAAWPALCAGQWSEGLEALTWILFYASLIGAVGGALASIGCSRRAIIAAYLAGSIPLACMHVYRPGYADLPLACFVAATVGSLLRWRKLGRVTDFVLAVAFASTAACTKREGIGYAVLTLLVYGVAGAAFWQHAPRRACLLAAVALAVGASITAWVVDFGDQGRAMTTIRYHPEVWAALMRHGLAWLSLGPAVAVLGAMLLGCMVRACLRSGIAPGTGAAAWLTAGVLAFVAGIFVLTDEARFALNDQTPSRLFLQGLPAMMLAWMGVAPDGRESCRTMS